MSKTALSMVRRFVVFYYFYARERHNGGISFEKKKGKKRGRMRQRTIALKTFSMDVAADVITFFDVHRMPSTGENASPTAEIFN